MRSTRRVGILGFVVLAAATACLPPAGAQAGAIRSLAADGNTCWAVGDAGCVLTSSDAGSTWQPVACGFSANFQSVRASAGEVWLFGGLGVPGHPSGAGVGIILHSADGGGSFQPISAGAAGWLYGGCFSGGTGVTFGQANIAAPAGMLSTIDGGRVWGPPAISSRGYVIGADFLTPRQGYLVGQDHRIISLRNLAEATFHPPASSSKLDLKAVAFCDPIQCWAVGENGRVLRSRTSTRPWDPIPLTLPGRTVMCADFEALITPSPESAYVAGGLIGVIPYTADAGATWRLGPAPGPGGIHALLRLGGGVILAGGDAQCIWRSQDAGATWRLVAGPAETDVLFIVGAGDRGVYPAIVAHAEAGCRVAVVYATALDALDQTAPDQPLRAAAIAAGAQEIATLGEFPSAFGRPALADQTGAELLHRWGVRLDVPAEAEMVHQLAAAIRLYRPAVLAVGPDGSDAANPITAVGVVAESRLVSRLAQQAAAVAADANSVTDLAKVNLPAWKPRRIFVGQASNERYAAPWEEQPRRDRDARASFDGLQLPNDRPLPLDILAARASWLLPGSWALDRPAEMTAYYCAQLDKPVRLFTSGLTDRPRLLLTAADGPKRDLVVVPGLRMSATAGQDEIAAIELAAVLEKTQDPDDATIAADRLLLAWLKLLRDGKLIQADAAQLALMKKGRAHPLGQKLDVIGLASTISSEWQAQLLRLGRPNKLPTEAIERAAEAYGRMPAWALTPEGRMLLIRALLAAGKLPRAQRELGQLSAEPYPIAWRRCAMLELGGSAEIVREALKDRVIATAALSAEQGKFDGRLDDACWSQVQPLELRGLPAEADANSPGLARTVPASPGPAASRPGDEPNAPAAPQFYALVSPARYAIFALRLPLQADSQWDVDLAIDADRDCWTQIVLHADTRGGRAAKLTFRDGPTADLGNAIWQIQAARSAGEWTMEIAIALSQLSARRPAPGAADLWNFQVRATAKDAKGRQTPYYLAPQADTELLPERYALLKIPAIETAKQQVVGSRE